MNIGEYSIKAPVVSWLLVIIMVVGGEIAGVHALLLMGICIAIIVITEDGLVMTDIAIIEVNMLHGTIVITLSCVLCLVWGMVNIVEQILLFLDSMLIKIIKA